MRHHFVITLIFIAHLLGGGKGYAQVTNYALQLSKQESMESLRPLPLQEGDAYTIQLSVKSEGWQQGGVILSLGEFKLEQSEVEGTLHLATPNGHNHKIYNTGVHNTWTQLSFVATPNTLNIWVNGELHDSYVGNYSWNETSDKLTLGGEFSGSIDEVRIFNTNIKNENLSHFNTLNKYHPNWDNLRLYYKFDQNGGDNLSVDSRYDNHGKTKDGDVQRIINSDHKSRYMVVSGYSSFIRHNDRPNIDQEMHLMTNDLIMLDAIVDGHSGRIYMQGAENGEVTQGAILTPHLDGRDGVLTLNGNAKLTFCDNYHEDLKYLNNALNFSAWVRLDEWREGAELYKKSVESKDKITISLTSGSKRGVKVNIEGKTVTFDHALTDLKKWQHIAVNIAPKGSHSEVTIYRDNKQIASKKIRGSHTINHTDALTDIGEGVVGALDNIVIAAASRSNFAEYISGTSRDFTFPNGGASASLVLGAWFFEHKENIGRNNASWQSKIEAIHNLYDGYEGYKIRFGIITHTKDKQGEKLWTKSIHCPTWRATLTEDVARINQHFDGVDIDFEWLDNNPKNEAWQAYGALIVALREAIGEDKVLSASLHPVSYTLPLDKEVMNCVDYITVQNYGPRHTYLKMDRYKQFFYDAVRYGIPAEKLFMSMATLIVRSDNSGIDVSGFMQLNLEGFTTSTNQSIFRGHPYTFNSVDEVVQKMTFLREKGSNGSMYFDMGNDLKVSHPLSLIRAMNSVISSNVERKTTK